MTETYPTAARIMSPRLGPPIGQFVHAVEVPAGMGTIYLSGMTSRDHNGQVIHAGDAAAQTRQVLENIASILAERDLDFSHIVKVVVYVKDIADLKKVHRVRNEYFVDAYPASTLIEVSAFVHPDMLVEIDSIAVVPPSESALKNGSSYKEGI